MKRLRNCKYRVLGQLFFIQSEVAVLENVTAEGAVIDFDAFHYKGAGFNANFDF